MDYSIIPANGRFEVMQELLPIFLAFEYVVASFPLEVTC